MVSVGNNSTIRVRKMVYSVPCRLIGVKLLARICENRIVLLAGAREVARLPLSRGDRGAVIDFRHLIVAFAAQAGGVRGVSLARGAVSIAGVPCGLRSSGARWRRCGQALSGDPQAGGRRRADGGGKRAGAIAGGSARGGFGQGGARNARHLAGSGTGVAGAAAVGRVSDGLRRAAGWRGGRRRVRGCSRNFEFARRWRHERANAIRP